MARSLAENFHNFPHVDFNFWNTTKVFTPDDFRYQQALLFNGLYLLFASAIILIIFVAYFLVCLCYFCAKCRTEPLKPRPGRSRCLRWLIALVAFLSFYILFFSAPLGLGFYANNKTKDGVSLFTQSASNIYNQFDLYKFKCVVIQRYLEVGVIKELSEIKFEINPKYSIPAPLQMLMDSVNAANQKLTSSGNLLKDADVNLVQLSNQCNSYEKIRWWITIGIYSWHLLVILVIFYSSYTQSRCSFVILTVMALISLSIMSASVAVETSLTVGASDMCVNPKESLLQYVRKQPATAIVEYYYECKNSSTAAVFYQVYNDVFDFLKIANLLVENVENDPIVRSVDDVKTRIDIIKTSISSSQDELQQLLDMLDCRYIHQQFNNGLNSICTTVLSGLGLLMLSALIISFFLMIMLFCITPIWKAMVPLRPILKREKFGVHLVTKSYEGPPGGSFTSGSFQGDSSIDASYKSIEDREEFEHIPLISSRDRPPSVSLLHKCYFRIFNIILQFMGPANSYQ
ncbi:protein tweety homolog 2 isoform X2 [Hydra vulgaris]|uniref:protein tweety homolog 2 isoform X2 n=1 Tax=Hydra vulgaris TaxID=6087 RepID=UPI001F5F60BB|nr:protein tweety homolog 2 isoform X2 [Hydra vulgaris]